MFALLRAERVLAVGVITSLAFLLFGHAFQAALSSQLSRVVIFAWLFAAIMVSVFAVVRHADYLAERLGEPFGTLILTLSVTAIEAMSITAVMLHGTSHNPTLVRDTIFAVIMIILNGMVGVSLLIGGLKHREQQYNLQGANAYLSVIVPLAVISLILPDFTETTAGPTLSSPQEVFLVLMSIGLYGAFLAIQTGWHRGFFTLGEEDTTHLSKEEREPPESTAVHVFLLGAYMAVVVYLADQLAPSIEFAIDELDYPDALGGLVIAVIVATPEAIGAARAAFANHMQRSVNIFLGSVLATIGLTIPTMLIIGSITHRKIILGIEHADLVLLALTLFVSAITFTSARTNVLQGLVHVLLFAAYLVLIFQN